jgi:hypothetical protein
MAYANIVYLQGEEAQEAFDLLNDKGSRAMFEHLKQWDYGPESEYDLREEKPWGRADSTVDFEGGYTLSYNHAMDYCSLTREVVE